MAKTIVGGDDNITVLTGPEPNPFTAVDRAAIDLVDRALGAGAARTEALLVSPSRVVTSLRAAPLSFRLTESIHEAGVRPLPLLVDVAVVAAVLAAVTGRLQPVAVAAFALAGLVLGLYRARTPVESQGVVWYGRRALLPVAAVAASLAGGTAPGVHSGAAAVAAALAALSGLLAVRLVTWQVVAAGRRGGLGLRSALLLGDSNGCDVVHRRMLAFPENGLFPVAWSDPATPGSGVDQVLATDVDHVLVLPGSANHDAVEQVVLEAGGAGLPVSLVVPEARFLHQPVRTAIGGMALLPVVRPLGRRIASLQKRLFDVVLAAAALVVTAPVLLVTTLAIWLNDRGPIFYCQRRVGHYGQVFGMWKFRSMVVGADQMVSDLAHANVGNGLLFKVVDDPRVTRVGRVIRRLAIDELPQLLNVLKGEMSLVGPRPLPVDPGDFDDIARRRHTVRPGITGLWQVTGGGIKDYDEMVGLDLAYIATWSLRCDLEILLRTLPTILVRRAPC